MKKKFISLFSLIIIAILLLILSKPKEPIKIGLMVTLTGVYPDLGREIRDGALLAVQMINEEGGINGRPVELIIRDNKYSIEQAKLNYQELVRENVVAVIGPATSTTAKNLLPIINQKKVLTIAPTPTSTELAGLDDYMIRLRPTNKEDATTLAKYVTEKFKIKKLAIIYDVINPLYTKDFINNFKSHFSKEVSFLIYPFDEENISIKNLAKQVLSQSLDSVLIITEVYNASLLIQNFRILNPNILLLISPWAKSPKLIEQGGERAEGVLTVDTFDEEYKGEFYEKFKNKFLERLGHNPNFASCNGFESVMLIKKAIEKGAVRETMKETLLRIGKFEGLQGEIIINKFGDREIKPFIFKVENGKFRRVKQ